MWKKILLVILVILAIIGAFTIYGSYKVVDACRKDGKMERWRDEKMDS